MKPQAAVERLESFVSRDNDCASRYTFQRYHTYHRYIFQRYHTYHRCTYLTYHRHTYRTYHKNTFHRYAINHCRQPWVVIVWGARQLTGDGGLYLPNCQINLVIVHHTLYLLFWHVIHSTAYHLGRYKP